MPRLLGKHNIFPAITVRFPFGSWRWSGIVLADNFPMHHKHTKALPFLIRRSNSLLLTFLMFKKTQILYIGNATQEETTLIASQYMLICWHKLIWQQKVPVVFSFRIGKDKFTQKAFLETHPMSGVNEAGAFLLDVACCSSSNTLNKLSPKGSAMIFHVCIPTIQHEALWLLLLPVRQPCGPKFTSPTRLENGEVLLS